MRKLWIPFSLFAGLLAEAVLSDYFYSNCINTAAIPTCTNNAQALAPLVVYKGKWFLSLMSQDRISISDTMGIVAGIGFIGMGVSFFALELKKGKLKALLNSAIVLSGAYILIMAGFAIFLPFCLTYPCRITNYIRNISYFEGLIFALVLMVSAYFAEVFLYIRNKRVLLR